MAPKHKNESCCIRGSMKSNASRKQLYSSVLTEIFIQRVVEKHHRADSSDVVLYVYCVCVCGICVSEHMWAYDGQRRISSALFYHFVPYSSEMVSCHEPGTTDAPVSVLYNLAVTGACIPLPNLLHEYWKFELRSSCLFIKCSNLLSYFSRLLFIFINLWASIQKYKFTNNTKFSLAKTSWTSELWRRACCSPLLLVYPLSHSSTVSSFCLHGISKFFFLFCFSSTFLQIVSPTVTVLPTLAILYSVNSIKILLSMPSLFVQWTLQ